MDLSVIVALKKFIKDLPNWKNELSKEDYDKKYCITWCSFFGTVPTIPNKLRGIDEADTMEFGGGFDKSGGGFVHAWKRV